MSHGYGVPDRTGHMRRLVDARGRNVERIGELGVIAPHIYGVVFFRGRLHDVALRRHDRIVENDGEYGDAIARRRLKIHPGHADGRIAHDVDADFFRRGDFGAHGQPKAVTELRGLAPTKISPRASSLPERQQLLARTA